MKGKSWFGIKPSTRAFAEEARRTPGYSLFDWLHGQVYARWPYFYIGVGTGEHPLARLAGPLVRLMGLLITRPKDGEVGEHLTHADTYHGKVVTLEAARQLVNINQDIELTGLDDIVLTVYYTDFTKE